MGVLLMEKHHQDGVMQPGMEFQLPPGIDYFIFIIYYKCLVFIKGQNYVHFSYL